MAFEAQIEMHLNNTFVVKLEDRLDTDTYPELQARLKPILVDTTVQPQEKKVFEIVKALPTESVFSNMEEADQHLDTIQRKELAKQR